MSVASDKKRHYRTISKTCYTANFFYLFLHTFYLILFLIAKFYVLAIITGVVVALYGFFFLMIKLKKYYPYVLMCGNEFFAFIIVTTTMTGFSTGFHFFLISFCVVSFFTTYFSKRKNIKLSFIWVGLSILIYLTLYFVTKFVPPYYQVEQWLEMTLYITHSVLAFLFIAGFMTIFVRYTLSLEKKIMNESRTDELTQIGNRYSLYDYFDTEDKSNKVLALFDIDDFKNINDKFGHVTGDYILKRVAEIATETIKDAFVCRYGGEEFVVVLNAENAFDNLELLRKNIEKEKFAFENEKIGKITVTIGGAEFLEGMKLEKWVELADSKMYFGKNAGKNQTVF